MNLKDIDTWRKGQLAIAEMIDAWRLIPRALVAGYAFMLWTVVKWYMDSEPKMLEGCDVSLLGNECIVQSQTNQHAVLVTATIGVAAAVFALYTGSGKKWNGFTPWNKEKPDNSD